MNYRAMNYDVITTSTVIDELIATVQGGRVQDSLAVNDDVEPMERRANHCVERGSTYRFTSGRKLHIL